MDKNKKQSATITYSVYDEHVNIPCFKLMQLL